MIRLKRVYDMPEKSDGFRILVDRLWPRGITKEKAKIDLWLKEVAPGDKLRKWFGHDPKKWNEFKKRYFAELRNNPAVEQLKKYIIKGNVTLLYSAKDENHNNAVALKEFLFTSSGLL